MGGSGPEMTGGRWRDETSHGVGPSGRWWGEVMGEKGGGRRWRQVAGRGGQHGECL